MDERKGKSFTLNKKEAIWTKETSPFQKLNDILSYLDRDDIMDSTYILIIHEFYGFFRHSDDQNDEDRRIMKEVNALCSKLYKEGYILMTGGRRKLKVTLGGKPAEEHEFDFFFISVDGSIFIHEGGYIEQNKQKADSIRQREIRENKLVSDSQRLADGTKYLWIATGCLVVVELLKWIWEYFQSACN